jgi:chromosome segregation ATPase
MQENSKYEDEISANIRRTAELSSHSRSLQVELEAAESTRSEDQRRAEGLDHLLAIARREADGVAKSRKEAAASVETAEDRLSSLQHQILDLQQQLEGQLQHAQWNRDEFEQWQLAEAQKRDDLLTLAKYSKEDERRLQELQKRASKLEDVHADLTARLDAEIARTRAVQYQLDSAAAEFQRRQTAQKADRERLSATIAQIADREGRIAALEGDIAAAEAQIASLDAEAAQVRREVEKERSATRAAESRQDTDRRTFEAAEAAKGRLQRSLAALRDEVAVQRASLRRAERDVAKMRAELNSETERLGLRQDALTASQRDLEQETARQEKLLAQLKTRSSSADAMQELLHENEASLAQTQKELAALKARHLAAATQLHEQKRAEADVVAEIQGLTAATNSMLSRVEQLDTEAARQREHLYRADFRVQHLRRRLERAEGARSDDERRLLKARISKLTDQLSAEQATRKLLLDQSRRLTDELAGYSRQGEQLKKRHAVASSALQDLVVETRALERTTREVRREHEDGLIGADLLRLKIRKVRDSLSELTEAVYAAENQQEQLKLSTQERRAELDAQTAVLDAELRSLGTDLQRARVDLRRRQVGITKLQAKYEVVRSRLQPSADAAEGKDAPSTQAYYIVKAAQDKQELREQGDALHAKVQKYEADNAALEAICAQYEGQVTAQRSSTRPAGNEDFAQRDAYAEQLATAQANLRHYERQAAELRQEIDFQGSTLLELQQQSDHLAEHVEELSTAKAETEARIADAERVLSSVERDLKTDARRLRGLDGTSTAAAALPMVAVEAAMASSALRSEIDTAFQAIREAAAADPEARIEAAQLQRELRVT